MAADTSYGQRDYILREIYFARDLLRSHPSWTVIDVTGKAIEETAADVLRLYHKRTGTPMH
jgi:regulator of PEP synthase PpsR (kinase-PPPase family)